MTINDCKITPHTASTIRVEAPKDYHIVRKADGEDMGRTIYDGIGTKLDEKYILLMNEQVKILWEIKEKP